MAVTNKRKEQTCEKYKIYLKIIYYFSNKVILAKQLYEYAVALNIVNHKIEFWKQIDELKKYDILKSEIFVVSDRVTQHEVLILKKYAIRYLEGKEKSSQVAAVARSNSNERILLSLFKNKFILDKIITIIKKRGQVVTFDSINTVINKKVSSLLFNKNQGLKYYERFETMIPDKFKNAEFIQQDKLILSIAKRKRENGLSCGGKATDGKGTKGKVVSGYDNHIKAYIDKSPKTKKEYYNNDEAFEEITTDTRKALTPKQKMLEEYNFDRMISNDVHVAQIVKKANTNIIKISLLIFDTSNSRNVHKIALNISSAYLMFNKYFNLKKCEVEFEVGVITYDQDCQRLIENDSNRRTLDYKTREKNELNKLQNYLKLNGLDNDMRNKINIKFSNYNLTDEYLEGIKYNNLQKNHK